MSEKQTAFVSHPDCSRHDTGWNHPDHQGRLPALMRAVYADMLTLFEPLLQVEGRHATEEELRLIHTPGYLARVRGWVDRAVEHGRPIEVAPGDLVSAATWDAASAAVGSALNGVDAVLAGRVTNAFCAVRPPGAGASADAPGGFGFFNTVAIAARYLTRTLRIGPVLVLELAGTSTSAIPAVLGRDEDISIISLAPREAAEKAPEGSWLPALPVGATADVMVAALRASLDRVAAARVPAFVLVATGFDVLETDPVGQLALEARDVYDLTVVLRDAARELCGGRLVSVLEGGYDASASGAAAVQHLRALAGLPRAA